MGHAGCLLPVPEVSHPSPETRDPRLYLRGDGASYGRGWDEGQGHGPSTPSGDGRGEGDRGTRPYTSTCVPARPPRLDPRLTVNPGEAWGAGIEKGGDSGDQRAVDLEPGPPLARPQSVTKAGSASTSAFRACAALVVCVGGWGELKGL